MAFKNFAGPTTPFSVISVGTPCHYKCNKALWILMDVALVLVEKRSPKQFEASRSKNVGPPPLKPTMYRTRGENINHITPPMQFVAV
jgi:hypothetical protein